MQRGDKHHKRNINVEGVRLTKKEYDEFRDRLWARPGRLRKHSVAAIIIFGIAITQSWVTMTWLSGPNMRVHQLALAGVCGLIGWALIDRCALRKPRREVLSEMGLLEREEPDWRERFDKS